MADKTAKMKISVDEGTKNEPGGSVEVFVHDAKTGRDEEPVMIEPGKDAEVSITQGETYAVIRGQPGTTQIGVKVAVVDDSPHSAKVSTLISGTVQAVNEVKAGKETSVGMATDVHRLRLEVGGESDARAPAELKPAEPAPAA